MSERSKLGTLSGSPSPPATDYVGQSSAPPSRELATLNGSPAPSRQDLSIPEHDPVSDWEGGSTATRVGPGEPVRGSVAGWVGARVEAALALVSERFGRRTPVDGMGGEDEESVALARTGGAVARWISFPRGVRLATAATSSAAAGLAAWGMLAMAANDLGIAAAAAGAAAALSTAWGPIGVRLANRLHRLVARHRLMRINDLRGVPDRRSVAVRGIVLARRTAASALDGRQAVWSLTRFRKGSWLTRSFFHETAFDFLLDDGTDEPIWVEVGGGMLLDPFPPEERVQFHSTTLLEIEHPFLTRLRLDSRQVWASELDIVPGDAIEVVGRLSRRLDPTARVDSGRNPPQRRTLRSGTRVPVMIKKLWAAEAGLARVRRLPAKGPPDVSPGEPPLRKF
jgi:hypothetical protein